MNFPVLSEIYYVEKGKGAWVERHSSNVSGTSRLRVSGIADFQDALVGPLTYDLVSLLEDARRDVSKTIQTEMKIHYLKIRLDLHLNLMKNLMKK